MLLFDVCVCVRVQIGMRCDSGIASICDESGLEIENAEILFTHEGTHAVYEEWVGLTLPAISIYCVGRVNSFVEPWDWYKLCTCMMPLSLCIAPCIQVPTSSRRTATVIPTTRLRCGPHSSWLCSERSPLLLVWCQPLSYPVATPTPGHGRLSGGEAMIAVLYTGIL